MGGIVHDLLPQGLNDGIPSVFFYSKNIGILCGEDAVRNRAKPVQNRMRYLKRHLGEPLVIDDKTMSYDSAITEVIQHCVRRANEQLKAGYQTECELVMGYRSETFLTKELEENGTLYIATEDNTNEEPYASGAPWRRLSFKGIQGQSGEGVTFQTAWNSSTQYTEGDIVVHNDQLWQATQNNQNQEPSSTSVYWTSFGEFSTTNIYVAQIQPAELSPGDFWFQIL